MAESEPNTHRFYVYGLVDPRYGAVFYVGKGTGRRMYQHEVDTKAGRVTNGEKHARIREILNAGHTVEYHVFRNNTTESDALRLERSLISMLGGLTNECSGQRTAHEMAMEWLRRVRPFCEWRRLMQPTPREVGWYWWVVAGLQRETDPDAYGT